MKDKMEREKEFRDRLAQLLAEFNAEICLDTISRGYEWDETKAIVYFHAEWDENGNVTTEFHEFDLL